MKKLLTKSLLVAICLLGGVSSVWAEVTQVFTENFESYTPGTDTPSNARWTITGGTGTFETSDLSSIGKYVKFVPASTSGNRGQSYDFAAADITSAGTYWMIEFDASFTSGADRAESSIAVTGNSTGDIKTNNAASGNLYFLCKQSANGSQTYNVYIGNSGDAASASYVLTAGTFYHFVIKYDGANIIAKIGDNDAVKKAANSSTIGALKGFKTCESRNAGIVCIDNISLSSLTAPAFTLSESSKTVSVNGSETIAVTDITGDISVKSNNTAAATVSYDNGTITINGIASGVATITVTGENDGLTVEKTIEVTVGEVATTTVTVNYLCGNAAIANPLVLENVTVGSILTGSAVTYDAIIYGTGCRYTNPVLSPELPYTVVENGVINISYTQQDEVNALDVYARINGENHLIKTIELEDKYVGDQISFNYPKYHKIGTTLYEISNSHYNTHGGYYKWNNYTLDGNSLVLDYDKGTIENVVYYCEGEDIDGMTADASSNADIRCSDGKGGRSTEELSLTTLGTGVYKLYSQVWGSKNENGTYTFRAAGADVLVHALTGALDAKDAPFSVVSGTAAITVQGSTNTGGRVLDYVYIQRIADYDGSLFNGDFSNATWNTGWHGTGTDKKAAFVSNTNDWFTGKMAEMWAGNTTTFTADGNLYQTLINVPVGNYSFSANLVNTVTLGTAVLYAKVGSNDDVTTDANNLNNNTPKSVDFTVTSLSNVQVGFKTNGITGGTGWLAADDFVISISPVSATLGANGYTTFASPYPLDLAHLPAGLKAYTATLSGVTLSFTECTQAVAAGTGLLLQGTGGETYNIPVVSTFTTVDNNALTGVTAVTPLKSDETNYIFAMKKATNATDELLFAPLTSANNVNFPAGKAYITVPASAFGSPTEARALTISFGDEATGVKELKNSRIEGLKTYYDLQGRRVALPTKGMYIKDGRKVVIK